MIMGKWKAIAKKQGGGSVDRKLLRKNRGEWILLNQLNRIFGRRQTRVIKYHLGEW